MSDFDLFWLGVAIYLAGVVTGIIIQIARTLSRGKNAEDAAPIDRSDNGHGAGGSTQAQWGSWPAQGPVAPSNVSEPGFVDREAPAGADAQDRPFANAGQRAEKQ